MYPDKEYYSRILMYHMETNAIAKVNQTLLCAILSHLNKEDQDSLNTKAQLRTGEMVKDTNENLSQLLKKLNDDNQS